MHQWVTGPIELLEDLRLVTPSDADAAIDYLKLHHATRAIQLNRKELFIGRILQCVVDKVDERARDRFPVNTHGWDARIDARLKRETVFLDLIAIGVQGVAHQLGDISLTHIVLLSSGLYAREIEDVVDQAAQPLALLANDAVVLVLFLLGLDAP